VLCTILLHSAAAAAAADDGDECNITENVFVHLYFNHIVSAL